ncbi:glycosyltransferase family 4 protein [Allocoleopsis franciscana]|uniref:Glycosyltransferase n=1 Tax=Allocoleopsis franciscana PCC 7113 TaxID=1173027 RepID=K9W6P9_9CYAN|nr:glycosyltransferase family 4 protein [Allocoleopsis franciscana]AFZ16040.1 glycosyltransferase [Allocoleopsis franciscana PCC 7113]
MKLCIITPWVVKGNGQGRVNYEIAWEAIRRGYHVTLLASHVAPELQQNSQVNSVQFSVKKLPTELLNEIIFAWRSAQWLRQHRQEFDLVLANGAVTWAASDVNLVPFVHGAWLQSPLHISRGRRDVYGFYQWLYTVLNARWEKNAFLQAKVVVAVSHRVQQELVDIGIAKEAIEVIWCGVGLEEFFPGAGNRKKFGLPEDVPLALFIGDIRINRKNLDTVLHAMVDVPELHLAVVGILEGSPYPQLAEQLGLSDRVHFLDNPSGIVPELMRSVDIFVFPSRYEPFGLVVIEAMASGLPIVTAITTGASELISPECGVVLSDTEDRKGLAEALCQLASNPELRHRMGKAARSVAEDHSWQKMAQRYVDRFEELSKR